jgi:hypothetical protein
MELWCVIVRRAVPPATEQVVRLVGPFDDQMEARRWIRTEGLSHLQFHLELHRLEEPGEEWRTSA